MTTDQIKDMICRYDLRQSATPGNVVIGCLFPERYAGIVRAAKPEILAFFDAARARRDHDEAKRGSGYFDCIHMLDRSDPTRIERLNKFCPMDEDDAPEDSPRASAWCRSTPELTAMDLCFSRYGKVPSSITVKWCKDFAEDAAYITGLDICKVTVHTLEGKEAEYDVEKNILRIYERKYERLVRVYENDNGQIWRPFDR